MKYQANYNEQLGRTKPQNEQRSKAITVTLTTSSKSDDSQSLSSIFLQQIKLDSKSIFVFTLDLSILTCMRVLTLNTHIGIGDFAHFEIDSVKQIWEQCNFVLFIEIVCHITFNHAHLLKTMSPNRCNALILIVFIQD